MTWAFFSDDGGQQWVPFTTGLPEATLVMDLAVSLPNYSFVRQRTVMVYESELVSTSAAIDPGPPPSAGVRVFLNRSRTDRIQLVTGSVSSGPMRPVLVSLSGQVAPVNPGHWSVSRWEWQFRPDAFFHQEVLLWRSAWLRTDLQPSGRDRNVEPLSGMKRGIPQWRCLFGTYRLSVCRAPGGFGHGLNDSLEGIRVVHGQVPAVDAGRFG